jgi:multidrug efflux pump subunit AcrB
MSDTPNNPPAEAKAAKPERDIKSLLESAQAALQRLQHYSLPLFLALVAILYGFLMYRIQTLSQADPSTVTVSNQAQGSQSLRVDQTVVKQLQSLQDNSVSVKSLFNDARSNPFQ